MQIAQKNFYKKLLGQAGEVKAREFLKEKGYKILDKNYKAYTGEIDIICEEKGVIIFVEVKTRVDDSFGAPSEAVTRKKQEKYFKTATDYLVKKGFIDRECRFDVIEIENGKINHIINAFSL